MIFKLPVVIFTCAALSNLTIPSNSWATEREVNKIIGFSSSSLVKQHQKNHINQQLLEQEILVSNSTEESENTQQVSAQTGVINRQLAIIGMGVTSCLLLLMLWILFLPEKNKNKPEQANKKIATKSEKNPNQDSPISNPLPIIKLGDTESDIIIGPHEIQVPNIIENETQTSALKQLERESQAINTAEIDIVFELIKDLQSSDRHLKHKAIGKLSQTGDFRAIEPLILILLNADASEQNLILDAITKIAQRGLESINLALVISLDAENSAVKKNAIQDAATIYQSILPIAKRLSQMTADSDQQVQQTAKLALQQLSSAIDPE
ncbi:PBS lyase HEAT domain protein repeat-containing protein [Chondrocystis sp. NIES-4102]|nr:PBS lyase HEAT domain protein repeat-containing protein [Chondrocystis sp. NIES-4102]